MAHRRSETIFADILQVSKDHDRDGVKITKLIQHANLTHSRIGKILTHLTSAGLMVKITTSGANTYAITEKGSVYLDKYIQLRDLAQSFGMLDL